MPSLPPPIHFKLWTGHGSEARNLCEPDGLTPPPSPRWSPHRSLVTCPACSKLLVGEIA
jgi:hypothetical protein